MKTMFFAILAASALAAPALAFQCPVLIGQIEEALAASPVDEATRAAATALLEEGRALHDGGDHPGSEAKLAQAKVLLGSAAE